MLRWTPTSLMFGAEQVFHFGFRPQGASGVVGEISVTVRDPSAKLPLVRSNLMVPSINNGISTINFDGDDAPELLVTGSNNIVYTLQKQGDQYVQDWVYPFLPETGGKVVQAVATDLDRDNAQEVLVATSGGLFVIGSPNSKARLLRKLQIGQFIRQVVVADIDGNAENEVVLLIGDQPYWDTGDTVVILQASSGETIRSFRLPDAAGSMAVGNVDNDAALEIVVNIGGVYDGATLANEWYFPNGFGNSIATGDSNADGVEEILGADSSWGRVQLFDARSQTTLALLENQQSCSVTFGNLDADLADEVVIGDCYWGSIKAYDLVAGTLVSNYEASLVEYGAISAFVGDADGDGVNELVWGNGQSAYGGSASLFIAQTDSMLSPWFSAQLSGLSAAGWASVGEGQQRAVFVLQTSGNGTKGNRVATLSEAGEVALSPVISNEWNYEVRGFTNDLDRDGVHELIMNLAAYYNPSTRILGLDDYQQIWAASENTSALGIPLAVADMNNDGTGDLINSEVDLVHVMDIENDRLIATLSTNGYTIQDIAVVDIDVDGDQDIVTADGEKIVVWNNVNASFYPQYTHYQYCSRIAVGNLGQNGQLRLVCNDTLGFLGQANIRFFTSSLNQVSAHYVSRQISDMHVLKGDNGRDQLLLANRASVENPLGFGSVSRISLFSPQSGRFLWSTPALLGEIPARGLHSFVDETGKSRLTFATNNAMYLTR